MNVTMIAAMADNRVLGKDNQLIWHMPEDLKRFKRLTTDHHVIMGRKTYESMNKPLPNRTNIIITRQEDYKAEGALVVNSMQAALDAVKDDNQPFIIGGAEIYKLGLDFAKKIELTVIRHEFEGDTFFPEFDKSVWKLLRGEQKDPDEKNPYPYEFLTYMKINPDSHN